MNHDENWKSDHCHREFFSHVIIQAMMYSRNGAVYRNLTCIYSSPIQSMDLLQYKRCLIKRSVSVLILRCQQILKPTELLKPIAYLAEYFILINKTPPGGDV